MEALKTELSKGPRLFSISGRSKGDMLAFPGNLHFIKRGPRDECATDISLELVQTAFKITALTQEGFCIQNAHVILTVGSRIKFPQSKTPDRFLVSRDGDVAWDEASNR